MSGGDSRDHGGSESSQRVQFGQRTAYLAGGERGGGRGVFRTASATSKAVHVPSCFSTCHHGQQGCEPNASDPSLPASSAANLNIFLPSFFPEQAERKRKHADETPEERAERKRLKRERKLAKVCTRTLPLPLLLSPSVSFFLFFSFFFSVPACLPLTSHPGAGAAVGGHCRGRAGARG